MSSQEAAHHFHNPVAIRYGPGIASRIGGLLTKSFGELTGVLVVSDRRIVDLGLLEPIRSSLADGGAEVRVFTVKGEPEEEEISVGGQLVREFPPQLIVGFGGGAALDAARAVNVSGHNAGELGEYEGLDKVPAGGLPLVSVPTTAGTGSEVGCGFVVTNVQERRKYLVIDRKYWSALAILDPQLTMSLPPEPTAYSGLDALAHAVGAHVVSLSQPLIEPLVLKVISLVFQYLPGAVRDGQDLVAREKMQFASAIAGMCLYNSECAADHAFGEVVGGFYPIPHGLAVAAFLPHTTRFSINAAREKYEAMARVVSESWPAATVESDLGMWFADALCGLNRRLGVPVPQDLGIRESDLAELSARTVDHLSARINPRPLTRDDALELYREALGHASW